MEITKLKTKDLQEAIMLGQYWFDHYAPKTLLASDYVVQRLSKYIHKEFGGEFSITAWNAAFSACAQDLEYKGRQVVEKIVKVEVPVDPRTPQEIRDEELRKRDARLRGKQRSDDGVSTEFDKVEARQQAGRKHYTPAELEAIGKQQREDAKINEGIDYVVRNVGGNTSGQRIGNKQAANAELLRLRASGISPAEVNKAIHKFIQTLP